MAVHVQIAKLQKKTLWPDEKLKISQTLAERLFLLLQTTRENAERKVTQIYENKIDKHI